MRKAPDLFSEAAAIWAAFLHLGHSQAAFMPSRSAIANGYLKPKPKLDVIAGGKQRWTTCSFGWRPATEVLAAFIV